MKSHPYTQIKNSFIPVSTLNLKYNGIWDMQELYESMTRWLITKKYKFHEKIYKHKHLSPLGIERRYIWTAEQSFDDNISVQMEIHLQIYDAHEIRISTHKEKRVLTSGKMSAVLKIRYGKDNNSQLAKSNLWAQVKCFVLKHISHKRHITSGLSSRLRDELIQLHNYMTDMLKIEAKRNRIYARYGFTA